MNWEDSPSKATPLSAENLNKMDKGIAENDERLTAAETEILSKADNESVENIKSRLTTAETELDNKVSKNATYSISENMIQPNAVSTEKVADKSITVNKLYGVDDIVTGGSQNLVRSSAVYTAIANTKSEMQENIDTKESSTNKVKSFDNRITDTNVFPTAVAVKEYIEGYYYNFEEVDNLLSNKADFESGTGSLTVNTTYLSNFTSASFDYLKIANYCVLNFKIVAKATNSDLRYVAFRGLPFVANSNLYRRIVSASEDDVYITFSSSASATSLMLFAYNGFSKDTTIQDTIIYQIK